RYSPKELRRERRDGRGWPHGPAAYAPLCYDSTLLGTQVSRLPRGARARADLRVASFLQPNKTPHIPMRIGVPKETKVLEHRVGLTPGSARELRAHGHALIVEASAGQGIGMDDDAYRNAGASIVATAAEVLGEAEMIVKVQEPQAVRRKK